MRLRWKAADPEPPLEELPKREPLHVFRRTLSGLRWLALLALSLACVAVFYVAVIMGEATELQQTAEGRVSPTPLPAAAPLPGGARSWESVELPQIEALFPGRLAVLPSQQGFVLEAGRVEDVRLNGVAITCRVVTLIYSHRALPDRVVICSAAPGAYIERYAQPGFRLDMGTTPLATLSAMGITAQDRRYFVAVQGEAVYAVEGPAAMDELPNVPGWVMLTGEETEPQPPFQQ